MAKRFENTPTWQGESLKNKSLYIYNEQGIGDLIQFLRFIPKIKEGYKILEVQEEIAPLLNKQIKVNEIVPRKYLCNEWTTPRQTDFAISICSLCNVLNINEIKPIKKYLKTNKTIKIKNNKFKIGICYAGSESHPKDNTRSLSTLYFNEIAKLPNVQVYSLQKGNTIRNNTNLNAKNPNILDISNDIHDFSDTAALIDQMDLIISVDTSLAHLSAAMGKNTWILVPFITDWRWLYNTNNSVWYYSAKLFRQPTYGDWKSVFNNILTELSNLVN